MHDPSTVAFTIPSPFARKSSFGKYRPPLVTIWHEDPCDFAGKERGRSDDSWCPCFASHPNGERE